MEPSTKPKKTGRPKATVDLELVEKLAGIACTLEDIAAVTGLSKSTLIRLGKQKSFQEALERGRGKGRASLRKMQWQSAEGIFETVESGPKNKRKLSRRVIVAPNVTAQIWLGKQMLGQRTEPEAPAETADKVTYEWVKPKPSEGDKLNTTPSPAKSDSTTPKPDSKASAVQ